MGTPRSQRKRRKYDDPNHQKENSVERATQVELVGISPKKPDCRIGKSVGMSGTG